MGIRCMVLTVLIIATVGAPARGETLLWDAVTTFTDGTTIAPATVSYQAYWSTDSRLETQLHAIGAPTALTSVSFNVDTEGMPRGSTVYFGCQATVSNVGSGFGKSLAWLVPPSTTRSPGVPARLRLN